MSANCSEVHPAFLSLPAAGSDLTIGQTFLLRFFQTLLFNQQPLPFITLTRLAPLQHYRGQRRILARPPCQRRQCTPTMHASG